MSWEHIDINIPIHFSIDYSDILRIKILGHMVISLKHVHVWVASSNLVSKSYEISFINQK